MKYTIKPLEWTGNIGVARHEGSLMTWCKAETVLGNYEILQLGPDRFNWSFPKLQIYTPLTKTLEAAKAAAEADWQSRIKEALEPVQDWISVEGPDLLPTLREPVIVYGTLEDERSADRHEGFRDLDGWYSARSENPYSHKKILNVTHWQPMPEPPKEEAQS